MYECTEIVVIMKDEENNNRKNFLCYESLMNFDLIKEYIDAARQDFPGEPDSVVVKTTTVIQ